MELLQSKIKQGFMSLPSSCSSRTSWVSPSAYDTAWVAMVPHPDHPRRPLFPSCLQWIVRSQRRGRGGFWGQTDSQGQPTLDCLTSTLASMVVLKTWEVGDPQSIEEGLEFIFSKTGDLLAAHCHGKGGGIPRWFAIVFPGMLELAASIGLDVFRGDIFSRAVESVFEQRRQILADEKEHEQALIYPPLDSFLEVLPDRAGGVHCAEVVAFHQDADGSLFRSPSSTAFVFMATGNARCRGYLETVVAEAAAFAGAQAVGSHGVGVPGVYPADELLHNLVLVNVLEGLGIAEHFSKEIADAMNSIHSDWAAQQEPGGSKGNMALRLYRDAEAFRLLRTHGYLVSPGRVCWFVHDEAAKMQMEKHHGCYQSAMLSVFKAADLAFPGEDDLALAKSISKRLLQAGGKTLSTNTEDGVLVFMDFQGQVEQELKLPWLARMEHLEHRRFIEEGHNTLWVAKASLYKFSFLDNPDVLRLAADNFEARQLAYRNELEEMKRWSKELRLSEMGFGREKTTYLYYTAAASLDLPLLSDARKTIAKCAIVVTVADDFYDMEGHLDDLRRLTQAVQRWEGTDLSGHAKVIFDALQILVEDLCQQFADRHGGDLTELLRNIWKETFASWMKEAEWSRNRHQPTLDEYLRVGMTSIAIQAMILPACYLLNPWQLLVDHDTMTNEPRSYDRITTRLMLITRLLNDLQSYEKEYLEGKLNSVMLLQLQEEEDLSLSVARVCRRLDSAREDFLKLALMKPDGGGGDNIPEEWKQLHLLCFRTFQMLFNGTNAFDSPTALLRSISIAVYEPLTVKRDPCPLKLDVAEVEADIATMGCSIGNLLSPSGRELTAL